MEIKIIKGIGRGKTLLSAFDAALNNLGVCNYNLITLSSIIPPDSEISVIEKYETPEEEFGYKLYVVKAEMKSESKGRGIASGIGWYPLEGGKGLFVEHETEAESEQDAANTIENDIKNSLSDLCLVRSIPFDKKQVKFVISSATVDNQPTCSLVLAVYKSESWK